MHSLNVKSTSGEENRREESRREDAVGDVIRIVLLVTVGAMLVGVYGRATIAAHAPETGHDVQIIAQLGE